MKVVITGGAGFLGRRLARRLLQRGVLRSGLEGTQAVTELVLVDVAGADAAAAELMGAGIRLRGVTADIADPEAMRTVLDGAHAVFHLAAIVSGQAEADLALGMRINLDASRLLLDLCAASGQRGQLPTVVFTSSVAVYGGALTELVLDSTALTPQSSYGTQKAMAELLLTDYSRRGLVDGRILRLPTISVRPGVPNKAASSFASGIIREPLNGLPAVCPVGPDLRLWLMSPRCAVEALIRGHELPMAALGASRAVNLPGVSVSVGDMVAALAEVAGPEVAARVSYAPDPAIERIVRSWPAAWDSRRAVALGFAGDAGIEAIIRAYIEER
jgi:nucleoside-diphosphate-sugar epimerase